MISEIPFSTGRPLSYLPIHEADWVCYSRLNDFPARKDPPCHSVRLHVRGVGEVMALHKIIFNVTY